MVLSAIVLAGALQAAPAIIPPSQLQLHPKRAPSTGQAPLSFANGMRVDCASGRIERTARRAPSSSFRRLGEAPDAIGQRAVLRLVDGCPTAVLIVQKPLQP